MVNHFNILLATVTLSLGCLLGCNPAFGPNQPAGYPETRSAYRAEREKLVAANSAYRFSSDIQLSGAEQQLNEQLVNLRDSMIAQYKQDQFFPPSESVYKSLGHIESTRLYDMLFRMPKGGVLHLHPPASLNLEWMVNRTISEPYSYVYWQENTENYVKGQIRFFADNQAPEGFEPAADLNESVPAFRDSLYAYLTTGRELEADSFDIWVEFERCFQRINGFVHYQPVFKDMYREAFQLMTESGVQHLEIRELLWAGLYDTEHEQGYYNADTTVRYYKELIREVRQTVPDFSLKLVYTSLRFFDVPTIKADVEEAFRLRKKYPGLIKAYDLVAEEDRGNTTLHYLDAWLMFDSLQQVYNIDLPFCFHDGESSWPDVKNLYDAVLLNSKRIGHGFNLFRFPELQEQVKAKDILVEVSPLSNQILGYVDDLRLHPAASYLAEGIQCSINPDDPGVFGYRGVTHDYWAAFLAWGLNLRDLKKLIINSITYSNLSEEEKEVALESWNQRWNQFVNEATSS